MAGDAVLTRDGPVSVPMDYQVPAGGELLPKTVRARIDGSGAAAEYYATVQVISPSGRVMGSYITEAIAAGVSADVTWFPGVSAVANVTPASGAWTQVFHYDVPALSAPTSIDTSGSTWSSSNNNIAGLFVGSSASSAQNDRLYVQVNGDTTSRYGWSHWWENKYIVGQSPAPAFTMEGNVTDLQGSLGRCGASGDSLGTSAFNLWIPRTFQSSQSAKIISTGGYAGLVSAAVGTACTSYIFAGVTRLTIFFASGAAFTAGSSLTLWAV